MLENRSSVKTPHGLPFWHRWRLALVATCLIAGLFAAAACTSPDTATPDANNTEVALFVTANTCSACHDGLTDADGNDISFVSAWSQSVHASASTDPYYLATVSHETKLLPSASANIEGTCATCHLPMANITASASGTSTAFLSSGFTEQSNNLHALYADGVSCLVCHQITKEGLGTSAAQSGGFVIDTNTDTALRTLYGPYTLSAAMQKIMEDSIGYTSQQADYLADSEFCATCHTLYTQPVDTDGAALDIQFPEQVPYLEWQQSSYAASSSCQSCHMPATAGSVMISSLSSEAIGSARVHSFAGGNTFLMSLAANSEDDSDAEPSSTSGLSATVRELETQTASLTVATERSQGKVTLQVSVINRTGHKLPTAFPSRRAWLHVLATDASGTVIFESGSYTEDGRIAGNDNDNDASAFEPHYTVITSSDQVQIYESILGDSDNEVTTGLMTATHYLKDNRLLPDGFVKTNAQADTAVIGEALNDADFSGGSDTVTYVFNDRNTTQDPVKITIELLYQPVGYRWLENLRDTGTKESDLLFQQADSAAMAPTVLASSLVTLD